MKYLKFTKLKNWEYWPAYMFYVPLLPYALYLALRAKNMVFFSAVNPAIVHSGNGSESKFKTLELIPESFRPTSIFIKAHESFNTVAQLIQKNNLKYPLIIKPDIGFRGLLVKKLDTEAALQTYLNKNNYIDLIIQEYVDYSNECGIFYHRMPNETKGKITSITLKKYLTVTGDGKATLFQLIQQNKRAKNYMDVIKNLHFKDFDMVLKNGEKKIISTIGNHSKGTQFINGNYLIDKKLEKAIDAIFKRIPQVYYGRIDMKYESFEHLIQLKDFKIIELNGIIAEPTHIYDSVNGSYLQALKEICIHWKLLYKIALINHSQNQIPFDKISDFIKSVLKIKKHTKLIKQQSLSI
ncbi:hypothetical protein [Lutibacter sp. B1]|uniref:hypothetical protein n=1 Tax=Lutibacter sp. B1 TaxID=2725996 RepID=UPI0014568B6D|nr:hypothetical protein [Lutibacter sp. B1]NLP56677.1 hypothetical protein [Lutibacter sp. B1]